MRYPWGHAASIWYARWERGSALGEGLPHERPAPQKKICVYRFAPKLQPPTRGLVVIRDRGRVVGHASPLLMGISAHVVHALTDVALAFLSRPVRHIPHQDSLFEGLQGTGTRPACLQVLA